MIIIFLGAPGAGKGTQSEIVKKKLKIPIISTGDIIRSTLKEKNELSKNLKLYTDQGLLVPDEIVINIIKNRISSSDCKAGFILDGFPRTVNQAQALEKLGININIVIEINVSDEVIYKRMSGRYICSKCNSVFNINGDMKPKNEGTCDYCGGKLIRRADDNSETVKKRLKVYYEQTLPLKKYYSEKHKLVSINGDRPLSETSSDIIKVLEMASL